MAKKKGKKKKPNARVEASKWSAIAAWAIPASIVAQTIDYLIRHFLK